MISTVNTHDTDFYTWTQEQAALLRQRRLDELDIDNLLEEIEDMGRSEKRELESRLAILIAHLGGSPEIDRMCNFDVLYYFF